MPGSVRKYEEQDGTNDKCRVRTMPQENDAHKMKEKLQRHEKQQCHKVAQTSEVSEGEKSTRIKSLNMQELVSKNKRPSFSYCESKAVLDLEI